jgi:acetate/butyrate---CoA ligase
MGSTGPASGFAAPERDIDDLPRNDANYTALTPLWFLERAALAHPGRASVVHGPVRYTWADTYRRCLRPRAPIRRPRKHGEFTQLPSLVLFPHF